MRKAIVALTLLLWVGGCADTMLGGVGVFFKEVVVDNTRALAENVDDAMHFFISEALLAEEEGDFKGADKYYDREERLREKCGYLYEALAEKIDNLKEERKRQERISLSPRIQAMVVQGHDDCYHAVQQFELEHHSITVKP